MGNNAACLTVFIDMQAQSKHLEAVIKAVKPTTDLKEYFTSVPGDAPNRVLQAIVCFYSNHYIVYVYSKEVTAWLHLDDMAVTKVGTFGDVTKRISSSKYQPNLLFYQSI